MSGKLSEVEKDELFDQLKQQNVMMNTKRLLESITEKCFKKCIAKPGSSLDSSERKCLNLCVDRFIDSWNLVSRSFTRKIQKENGSGFS